MTIMGFIRARLAEVEESARRLPDGVGPSGRPPRTAGVQTLRLARAEVMRAVVAEHECDGFSQICLTCRRRGSDEGWASEEWPCPTVRQVAALWTDHPDYDASWSPPTYAEEARPLPRRRRTSNGAWLRDTSEARVPVARARAYEESSSAH
jgi:hypothetical protein